MNRTSLQGIRNRLSPFAFLLEAEDIPPLDLPGMEQVFYRLSRMLSFQFLHEMSDQGLGDRTVDHTLGQDPTLRVPRSIEIISLWCLRNVPLRLPGAYTNRMRSLRLTRELVLSFRRKRSGKAVDDQKLWDAFCAWVILLTDELEIRVITGATHPQWWSDFTVMAPRHHPQLVGITGEPLNMYPFFMESGGKVWIWEGDTDTLSYSRFEKRISPGGDDEAFALGELFCRLLQPSTARKLLQGVETSPVDLDSLENIRRAMKSGDASDLLQAVKDYRFHLYRLGGLGRPRNHFLDFLALRAEWRNGEKESIRRLESLISRAPGMRAPYDLLIRLLFSAGRSGEAERWIRLKRRIVIGTGSEETAVPEPIKGSDSYQKKEGDLMEQVLIDMREKKDELPELVGRDEERIEALEILSCMQRNNVLVVGDPGVGKTAFIRNLVDWIGKAPESEGLHEVPVFQLDLNALIAGVQYRGQLEEKLIRQLDTVAREAGILFLDDVHEFLGEGVSRHSLADIGVMLRPYLDREAFRVIAATTHARYSRMEESGGVFVRLFQKLELNELELPVIREILSKRATRLAEFHGVGIDVSGISRHIELVKQFFRDRLLPDKALEILDRTCSRLSQTPKTPRPQGLPQVTGDDFLATMAETRGIEVAAVSTPLQQRLRHLDRVMRRSIVGQDHVLDAMMRRLVPSRMGMKINPERPDGVFLFIGPSGVGKTETARVLSRELYGDERKLLRIDMSEYMEEIAVTRLVGAAPGYVGYDDGNQLIDDMLRDPYRVVLLDEIEKAHPLLINIFLQVFDSGLLTDSRGRRAYFDKAVIIMTSNLGSGSAVSARIGFPQEEESGSAPTKTAQTRAMKRFFRPEFLNRIDEIVHFNPLSREHARRIVKIHLKRLNSRFIPRGLEIRCSEPAVDRLAELGFSQEYGAREILRTIEKEVMRPVAQTLLDSRRPVRRIHVGFDPEGKRLVMRRFCSA